MATATPVLDRAAALEYLHGRIDYERAQVMPYGNADLRLDRMRVLLARLGSPEAGLTIVHVAGTKGKGSTAAMIAAALTSCGVRTGLYTSPHLERVEERLAIDGVPCPADELCELVRIVQPAVAQMDAETNAAPDAVGPTYFEILTALALIHFRRGGAKAAVLEVGLGGRLDSTNVCQPAVCAITSISFDHTQQLGNTLAEIAAEKAGIIKPGVPVISGVIEDEPRRVIVRIARQRRAPLVQTGGDFDFAYRPARRLDEADRPAHLDFFDRRAGQECVWQNVALNLPGRHQAANAAVALATLSELRRQGWSLSEERVRAALAALRWPARVEVVARRPTIVIDAAHNVASVDALLATLADSFGGRKRRLIFATTRDKDVRGMLARLLPRFDEVVLTRYRSNPRGVPVEQLDELATELSATPCHVCPDPAVALHVALEHTRADDLLVITGSFFIAAEIGALLPAASKSAESL